MIQTDEELTTTLSRIQWFQNQVASLRKNVPDPNNYRASSSGFLSEIDRMQLEVREFLSRHPAERVGAA